MANSDYPSAYRILNLPSLPFPNAEKDSEQDENARRFSPNSLLGGFLVGPENRLGELAYRLAVNGVPVFDRAIGAAPLDPVLRANVEPSRADVELLLRAAQDDSVESIVGMKTGNALPASLLFDVQRYNASRLSAATPQILGYSRIEDLPFLAPLVFYGPAGSGKTQIIEGICQQRRLFEPAKTLYYISAADFSRSLGDAIRRDKTPLFRQLFSQAHVVAIEDADLLAEKEAAQYEFLPLLDNAIRSQKLVILSFSRNPASIPGFIPDLAARLAGGLLIPTALPSAETRRVVVQRLAASLALPLDEQALELCVQKTSGSIGAICATMVQAAHELVVTRQTFSRPFLEDFFVRRNPSPNWSLERIVKVVAKYFAVSVVEMRSKKRSKTLVLARRCVVFLARKLTDATFQDIGRQFSNRDHSTMIHATHELEEELEKNEELKFHLLEIARILKAEDFIAF